MQTQNKYYVLISIVLYTIFIVSVLKHLSSNNIDTNDSLFVVNNEIESMIYDTDINKPNTNITTSTNSVILILAQNKDLKNLRATIRELEDRFNRKFKYPYVLLNDKPFTDEFKYYISSMVSGKVEFGLIPEKHWSIPSNIKQKAKIKMKEQADSGVLYGGMESYHHMCRYYSGFFMHHELLQKYDYYWRVEPDVHFFCDIDFDPFLLMKLNKKEYGFTISLEELPNTVPSLWQETINFAKDNKLKTNLLRFFADRSSDNYNMCHFWSNFEIASFKFFRSEQYQNYFKTLDNTGNFFFERWGDAPIHSIAAGLFLNKSQVHFFNNIGYQHADLFHCPDVNSEVYRKRCICPSQGQNFDNTAFSCLPRWNSYKDQQWDFT